MVSRRRTHQREITEAFVSTVIDNFQGKNVTSQLTQDCECVDITNSKDAPQPGYHTKNNLTIAINASPVTVSNDTNEDCTDNSIITTTESAEYLGNEIKPNDTVLKYVYKKKDNIKLIQKTQGHAKNSLKRRKRSNNDKNSTEDTKPHESQASPLIVNYQTSHDPVYSEPLILNRNTGNIIKNSNLADFNIETLHENVPTPHINGNIRIDNLNINSHKNNDESIESDSKENRKQFKEGNKSGEIDRYENSERPLQDRTNYKNSEESEEEENNKDRNYQKQIYKEERKPYDENDESRELQNYKENVDKRNERDMETSYESEERKIRPNNQSPYTRGSQESNESEEKKFSKNNKVTDTKTKDSSEFDSTKSNEKDSNESKDDDYIEREENYIKHAIRPHNNENIKIVQKSSELNSNEKEYSNESQEFIEDSNENNNNKQILKEPRENYKNEKLNFENKTISPNIQDVDLGDFSYERIQVNEKGQVEPAKNTHENYDEDNASREGTQSTTSRPESLQSTEDKEKYSTSEDEHLLSRIESSEDAKQPISINDGEIKPVVEITGEINSEELTETQNINDAEDNSLETVLGIKKNVDNGQNEKIIVQNDKVKEKGDVKQQFERIPLNYKHDEKNQAESENNPNKVSKTTIGTDNRHEIIVNEGTLDTLSPKDENYDEHLKFKFDDVTVKLPEIKLPEDILAYTYDDSPYDKKKENNQKPRFFEYNDEDEAENQNNRKPEEDDYEYEDYYGKYKEKDDYKKKKDKQEEEDDDEYVDLYEKFVRERFGKKGSFQQRSEKLKDATKIPENDKLYETIHEVLKKTQDVQKQAEKSGDPNAGYMWTLEYGQNL